MILSKNIQNLIIIVMLISSILHGADSSSLSASSATQEIRHHLIPSDKQVISPLAQLGLLYLGQWGYYVTLQKENIEKHGSFTNWKNGFHSMHFDKDSYDYNLILHTVSGSLYYGYYRGFGHSRPASLAYSVASTLLFEFTIETITEPPSIQDIYQTPVYGVILGVTLEELSLYLLNFDSYFLKTLGHLANPFTLIPRNAWDVRWAPVVTSSSTGGILYVQF